MMAMRLEGRTALVTGGNRGIGFEVCRQLAAERARVVLGSRDRKKGEEAAAQLARDTSEIKVLQLDLSNHDDVLSTARELEDVDILVNNAAVLDRKHLKDLDPLELEYTIRTDLIGPFLLAQHLSKNMEKRRWGRIVNVSSGMGAISRGMGADSVAYRLSKLALNGFTLCLAEALRGTGVLVNSVDPGWVRTEMGGPMAHKTSQEGARAIVTAVLLPDRGPSGCFFRDGKKVSW
jgi:NAD(P)-dependent dehydrogenase (short-subunit alcohol dehydrogenase family)